MHTETVLTQLRSMRLSVMADGSVACLSVNSTAWHRTISSRCWWRRNSPRARSVASSAC